MKQYIFSLLFVALAFVGYSQEMRTFAMQFEGEAVLATQDVDQKYLGVYLQDKGSRQFQYTLQANKGSFLEKQGGEWNVSNQRNIEWGFLVKDNQIAKATLTEFDGSEMYSFEAMILLVHDMDTHTYTYHNLYERDGAIYLEEAVKIEEVAKN